MEALVYCVTTGGTFRVPVECRDKAQCAEKPCPAKPRNNADTLTELELNEFTRESEYA